MDCCTFTLGYSENTKYILSLNDAWRLPRVLRDEVSDLQRHVT